MGNESAQKVKRRFSGEERTFVATNLTKLSPEEIGKHLGRSPSSIIKVIKSLTEKGAADNTVASADTEKSPAIANPTVGNNAGDLMAKRPGITMMTSEASQALDEFKKVMPQKTSQHEKNIFRIRNE